MSERRSLTGKPTALSIYELLGMFYISLKNGHLKIKNRLNLHDQKTIRALEKNEMVRAHNPLSWASPLAQHIGKNTLTVHSLR